MNADVLHVKGDVDLNRLKPRNAIILQNSPGLVGQALLSQGPNKPPTWSTSAASGPEGQLGFVSIAASQTVTTTALTTVTGLSVTVVLASIRKLKVTGFLTYQVVLPVQEIQASIWMDGSEADTSVAIASNTSATYPYGTLQPISLVSPAAGSHTFTIKIGFSDAGNNVTSPGSAYSWLLVEDIGA